MDELGVVYLSGRPEILQPLVQCSGFIAVGMPDTPTVNNLRKKASIWPLISGYSPSLWGSQGTNLKHSSHRPEQRA